jgi:hypothetical protein
MAPSNLSNRGCRPATNFSAARNAVFTALLCYARITPAALHCGKIAQRGGEGAEAAGGRPEFRSSDSPGVVADLVPAFAKALRMTPG